AALVELGAEPPPSWGRSRRSPPPEELAEKTASAVVWSPDDSAPAAGVPGAPGEAPGRRPPPEGAPAGRAVLPPSAVPAPPSAEAPPPPPPPDGAEGGPPPLEGAEDGPPRPPHWSRGLRSHPFFQSSETYRDLYEKQGLHMMVLMLNYEPTAALVRQDWLLRLVTVAVALAAAAGLALAWRSLNRSADLQVRLIRARATNTYLRELNLASAGLAHETRNPLNLVRGITQIVASDEGVPAPRRQQLQAAIEEVDRITARLNEFIDYTKPREPRPEPVAPTAVARDVARTLQTDLEDKHLTFDCPDLPTTVLADPTMLRQVLFNLILNAVQAVPEGGHIGLRLAVHGRTADLDVIDDGPGVPEHARTEIFRPYFSLSAKGSGLGLAVVRQIALAHGWDLSCLGREPAGSIFRIAGMATRQDSAA
ncbi:MAG: HAMP domain-containing histidine kinase, partial [Lentisphaerae bacterium]|nr:HAMP domain-containing histidine kinase [Lentisphaerota bacterium]